MRKFGIGVKKFILGDLSRYPHLSKWEVYIANLSYWFGSILVCGMGWLTWWAYLIFCVVFSLAVSYGLWLDNRRNDPKVRNQAPAMMMSPSVPPEKKTDPCPNCPHIFANHMLLSTDPLNGGVMRCPECDCFATWSTPMATHCGICGEKHPVADCPHQNEIRYQT